MNDIIIEETALVCYDCGCEISEDEAVEVDGELYCQSCFDDYFVTCDRCGAIVRDEDAERDDYHTYCQSCYDDYYVRCEECNEIISRDDAYYRDYDTPYCRDCYDEGDDGDNDVYIHDYNYKPCPDFHGRGDRYFGVELEIDGGGKCSDKAEDLLEVANRYDDNIYIKTDGSLNSGLEIVTHPMTLSYHEEPMCWDKILDKAKALGYLSHKTDTCGLHIHVNRTTFGTSRSLQDECISRVLYFVEHHWEEMLKFSRRSNEQMNRWAARYGYKNNPQEVMDDAKSGRLGRYTCVNITNYDTIEFRMFRGTLKLNTLLAALQMVNAICDAAIFMSDAEISGLSWSDFVKSLPDDKYPALITYMKERRLYVNEAINFEEDE